MGASLVSITQASFTPVGGVNYYLYGSGVGATDTTATLVSFNQPVNGYHLTMADFGATGYFTYEPGNALRQEFGSFTGITQNSDGTATLTGVTRGLSSVSPYTASTTLRKAHPGGTIVVLSNSPQFYQEFAILKNDVTVTGNWHGPDPTDAASFATKNYVDGAAFGGVGNASETAGGKVEIATGAEAAAGTTNGSVNRLALPSSLASSTCSGLGNIVPVTNLSTKRLNSNCIATSTAGTLYPYVLPPTPPVASSSVIMSDASGNATWNGVSTLLSASSTISGQGNASTTVYTATVPAGALGSRNAVRVSFAGISLGGNNGCFIYIEAAYGNATTSATFTNASGGTKTFNGNLNFYITGNGATNAQKLVLGFVGALDSAPSTAFAATFFSRNLVAATDSTVAQPIIIRMANAAGCGGFTNINDAVITELLRN